MNILQEMERATAAVLKDLPKEQVPMQKDPTKRVNVAWYRHTPARGHAKDPYVCAILCAMLSADKKDTFTPAQWDVNTMSDFLAEKVILPMYAIWIQSGKMKPIKPPTV